MIANLYNILSNAYGIDIDSWYRILKNLLHFTEAEREAAAITCERYIFTVNYLHHVNFASLVKTIYI